MIFKMSVSVLVLQMFLLPGVLSSIVYTGHVFLSPQGCSENVVMADSSSLMRTFLAPTAEMCASQCGASSSCLSYNAGRDNAEGPYTCELHNKVTNVNGDGMVLRPGYTYYEKVADVSEARSISQHCDNYVGGYTDCQDSWDSGIHTAAVYDMYTSEGYSFTAYCDVMNNVPGVTILRRIDGTLTFDKNWAEYKAGFGDQTVEHWLGLETIYQLTKSGNYKLRVEYQKADDLVWYWAEYANFYIGDESTDYTLHVADYTGNGHERLMYCEGCKFTTLDRDNDIYGTNCANNYENTGWWYTNCYNSQLTRGFGNHNWYWTIREAVMKLVRK